MSSMAVALGAPQRRTATPPRCAQRAARPRVLHSAAEVPVPLLEDFIADMAVRLSRTPEARSCVGLSFTFVTSDVDMPPARYEVSEGGLVAVRHSGSVPSTFTLVSKAETFDGVLRGTQSATAALLRRSIRVDGSLSRILALLRMLPALQQAYAATREQMVARYSGRYRFAF
ncbi:MAG TPA: hypothetical protein VF155_01520 [Candidatus Dormibacteraeota bacterium]